MQVQSLGWEDTLEEVKATHPSILAWRIPWTEEPGGPRFIRAVQSQSRVKQLSMHTWTTDHQAPLCDSVEQPPRLSHAWDSPGMNTGVGWHALLQGIFLIQGLNPHLLYLLHWQMGYYH